MGQTRMKVYVLGSINLDLITNVENLPSPGETVLALSMTQGRGGKGANQAVAAARHGAVVSLHAAVGDDAEGRELLSRLSAEGVDVSTVVLTRGARTGRALVTVARNGENMIVVDVGANAFTDYLPPTPPRGPSVLLAQLETPPEAAAALFSSAGKDDIKIVNMAPATKAGARLLSLADLVVVNRGELEVYAGHGDHDVVARARRLFRRSDQQVVVTLGGEGALIVAADYVHAIPSRTVRAVDTTGAGDCFVGVLAACLAEGDTVKRAVEVASVAAALSVQQPGADAAPSRKETLRALAGSRITPAV